MNNPQTVPAAPQPLNPHTFPLWGSRLIEASAGTGKTWTIAALYLRLVLGHGTPEQAFARPLAPSEILVMTFTRAATRELSDRIRSRLLQAARCFRGEEAVPPNDPFLQQLLADHPAGPVRSHAAWRLASAAEGMDEASVHTIDAWCQRMLREHAFDSGNLFDEALLPDEQTLLTQATQDFWRRTCYPLDAATLTQLLATWKNPEALANDVRELLQLGVSAAEHDEPLHAVLGPWEQGMAHVLADRVQQVAAMRTWLLAQLAQHRAHWHASWLKTEAAVEWFQQLQAWADQPRPLALPALSGAGLTRLTPTGLVAAYSKKAPPLSIPPAFDWFAQLVDAFQAQPMGPLLRTHAATQVARRLAQLKRQTARFGFADMLTRLDAALHGPQGQALRQRIVAQYPVALIDEFQDTSPLQYRLFSQIYLPPVAATPAPDNAQALLLIGDPKQSIYGFRGADIYSYLQARRATEGRHCVLQTNHRSTHALVAAVNHCFEQAEVGQAHAAFMFKNQSDNPLPFVGVAAKGRKETLRNAAGPVPAVQLVHDLALQNGDTLRRQFAARCAEHIATSLNDPQCGFAAVAAGEGEGEAEAKASEAFERLRPRDVAVLVRTGKEAAAVRRALQRRGVASVYLSDRDSVFDSTEAADLVHWLRGVASPQEAAWVRAALAVGTLGLSLAELGQLATDDDALGQRSQHLRELQHVWRSQGVLAMLRQTLHRFQLAKRWLAQGDGERRLTNYLHLAELLQTASAELEGEQALIRWLQRQTSEHGERSDEQVLRLESDADLVKVVTVHKSKGLEYPVVYLPFASSFREVSRQYLKAASLPNADGQRELLLNLSDGDVARADGERLREDLRLLYVAMTRPRHALWLGFAAAKVGRKNDCQTHRSALGQLLGGGAALAPEAWLPVLEQLAEGCPHISLQADADLPGTTRLARVEQLAALLPAQPYTASFDRDWGIASYSRLTRDLARTAKGAQTQAPASDIENENTNEIGIQRLIGEGSLLSPLHVARPADDELMAAGDPQAALPALLSTPDAALPIWHSFQRGPVSGNFLHDQLEWLATEGFAHAQRPDVAHRLRQRCERAGHTEHAEALVAWLQTLASTPLPLDAATTVALSELAQPKPEMEFWLPTQRLATREIDALCHAHWLPGVPRPALPTSVLHGMLMGFADLVFEHQGRYWVLDYKSNHLGHGDAAYHPPALHAAMAHHRYDVQAAVYLLALHQLLASRLGAAYDPAQHLGGAVYWFVRGHQGPTQGVCVLAANTHMLTALQAMLTPAAEPATGGAA